MRATDSNSFVKAWTEYVNGLYVLGYSLPSNQLVQFKADVERLREYVKIASDHTYGEKTTKPQSQLARSVVT